MAKINKIEEQLELNCSAEKIFEVQRAKQSDIAELSSHKVPGVEAHQGDWLSVGSTRKWDLIIGGKLQQVVDKIEAIDEENMITSRSIIDGEMMSHYKSLRSHVQVTSKGNDDKSCIVKISLEYEKINEDAPEPKEFLNFVISLSRELGRHFSSAN